jgi:hypothetical protein
MSNEIQTFDRSRGNEVLSAIAWRMRNIRRHESQHRHQRIEK